MKVEYIAAGADDCPLVRLYAFTAEEVAALHGRIKDSGVGRSG